MFPSAGTSENAALPALAVRGLRKTFGALVALDNLSFEVREREIFGIAGPNGAGKSTLLNVCTGMLPASAGEIYLGGERIDGEPPYRLCHRGLVRTFQVPQLFNSLTVFDNVATGAMFGTAARSIDVRPVPERVEEVLAITNLSAKRMMPVDSVDLLSRKMVMLAAALVTGPRLVFMDEPMAGLTGPEIDRFVELISDLHARLALTFMIIEHKVRALARLCDRIMIIHYGNRIALDTPEKALRDPQVIDVYLGAEYFA